MITKHAKRMFITASVLFVCVLILFIVASYYLYVQGVTLRERAQLVANYAMQRQAQYKLSQALEASGAERDTLHNYILTEAGAIDFLADIEADAARVGVKLQTDALKQASGKEFDILTVQFTISGTESAVHTMVQALEVLPYRSHITHLSLTNSNTEAGVTTGTVELVLSLLKP